MADDETPEWVDATDEEIDLAAAQAMAPQVLQPGAFVSPVPLIFAVAPTDGFTDDDGRTGVMLRVESPVGMALYMMSLEQAEHTARDVLATCREIRKRPVPKKLITPPEKQLVVPE